MPQRNVATNFTFEQQRQEINLLAADFWTQKGIVDGDSTTYLKHDGSNAFTGTTLNVPNAFTINANSGSGTLTISGNLDVTGTTTTVNSANLEVTDKNILIAKGSTSDSQADGAGITIDSATDITFNFVDANDALVSSIGLEATTFLKGPYGQFTGSGTPSGGQGVEINAPDTNTGQIISYDRANTAYKELRVKGSSVGVYTGTSNALVGSFNSNGLTMESGKTITGVIATADQPNITSVGTLSSLTVSGSADIGSFTATESIFDNDVAVGGNHPWSVTSGNFNNLSISGNDASSSGFLNLGNGAAATNADFDLTRITIYNGATGVAQIAGTTATSANDDGTLRFLTRDTGGSLTERLRIDSSGNVTVKSSSSNQQPKLKIESYGEYGEIKADGNGSIIIDADPNFNANDSYIGFKVDGDEKVHITNDGKVGINDENPDLTLHVKDGDLTGRSAANSNCDVLIEGETNTGIQFYSGTQIQLRFGDAASTASGAIIYQHTDDQFKFNYDTNGFITFNSGGGGETLRITTDKVMTSVDIKPDTHQQRDIGTASNSFRNIYSETLTASTIYDSKGEIRKIIIKANATNNYNLISSDAGKAIHSSADVVVPNAVFSAGDAITLINSSSSNMRIAQGTNVTMYNSADGSTGNRTLSGKGMATLYWINSSTCYISGAGLS